MKTLQIKINDDLYNKIKLLADENYMSVTAWCKKSIDIRLGSIQPKLSNEKNSQHKISIKQKTAISRNDYKDAILKMCDEKSEEYTAAVSSMVKAYIHCRETPSLSHYDMSMIKETLLKSVSDAFKTPEFYEAIDLTIENIEQFEQIEIE